MKSLASRETIHSTVNAWEYYCEENYEKLKSLAESEDSPEIADLSIMLEAEKFSRDQLSSSGTSLFSPLAEGILAYVRCDHKVAASVLGNWLLNKNYYSAGIISKFSDAAVKSKNYSILGKVAKKFLDLKNYRDIVAEPIFLSLFHTQKYKEAVAFYEKYNESFNSEEIIQKVAFAMIQLDRFKDAERILVALYEKITGASYQINYEKVKEKYRKKMELIPHFESRNNLTNAEHMELGMAYLFSERYSDAIKIFKKLSLQKAG